MINFKEWLVNESKQSIINLGYPEVISKILYKIFKDYAFTVAKWYHQYTNYRNEDNWWTVYHRDLQRISILDLVDLYNATNNPEKYQQLLNKLEISQRDEINQEFLNSQKNILLNEIEEMLLSKHFFNFSLIQDVLRGNLKNLNPYKDLSFEDAQEKYDKKNIFQDKLPIKTYKNGFKWINVGKKCTLVGHLMKNCGSAGVMGSDPDRTILTLFDSNNLPHVVVVYSPNEKRISGDEGVASSAVKTKYHRYILDIAKTLNVKFDSDKSKSKLLNLKYQLQDKATNIRTISKDTFNQYFRFEMASQIYYSNGYSVVNQEDILKVKDAIKNNQTNFSKTQSLNQIIFYPYNREKLISLGVRFTQLNQLI